MKHDQSIQSLENTAALTCFVTAVNAMILAFGVRISVPGSGTLRLVILGAIDLQLSVPPGSRELIGYLWGGTIVTYLLIALVSFCTFATVRSMNLAHRIFAPRK